MLWTRRQCLAALVASGTDWPGFRGDGSSHTEARSLPLEWSADKLVAWSIRLPGPGASSPAIWKDLAYVVTEGPSPCLSAIAVDKGTARWQQRATASAQKLVPGLTPTPYVDPTRIYALFESGEIFGYTLDGRLLWKRQLADEYGGFRGPLRDAGSVARSADHVLVLVARRDRGYILALDPDTGNTDWKLDRPAGDDCTSTPVLAKAWGREVAILDGGGVIEGRSTVDGKLIWQRTGLDANASVTPAFATHPQTGDPLLVTHNAAFRVFPPGRAPEPLWKAKEASASMASPLVHDGMVHFIDATGVLRALELATGAELWSARLRGEHWVTPVAGAGRLYCFGADGTTSVLALGRKAQLLAENKLDNIGRVTGVAVGTDYFLVRTSERLLRISSPPPAKPKYEWGIKR
jgi:outer membrane protein assembly factor BamB